LFMVSGIEIGGTKLQLVLGDEDGKIQQRLRLAVDPARGASGIREQIKQALPQLIGASRISSIGVGFGGPVDWKTAKICRSHQIEGWSEFDLGGWLTELTGARAQVDNDANVASLGEARCGAGLNSNPVFYVTLGSGVGGGLVVNGEIYHGASPGEAEIGHIRLDRKGTILESCCSGWAIDARIRDLKLIDPGSALCKMPEFGKGGEAKLLPLAIKSGDGPALRVLRQLVEDLAFGLSHVVHLFHPEVIVLGGGLSGIGEPLREGVEQMLPGFVMEAFRPGPRIALAGLGEDAVPVGALLLASSRSRG
jgi:glucokinase